MREIFKNYFAHQMVISLWLLFLFFLGLCIYNDLLIKYPLWALLTLIIAPFYEWYTHKFLLHAKLSTRFDWLRKFQIKLHHEHHHSPNDLKFQFIIF